MLIKGEYIKFEKFELTIKSPFMSYAGFEIILVHEDNGKQNPNVAYTKKHRKHAHCSYCYKLVYDNDKFSNLFKSYLGEDSVHNFISSMTK